MTSWTKEQQYAIDVEGNNVIVSAGAGSGKTAVLTQRVITKLKKGISLKQLIILTFTNLAAQEMKERIKKQIEEEIINGYNLKEELDNIDQAIICTFDSYALYLVKKYSSVLNIDKNINIGDKIVFDIKLTNIIDDIFEKKYNKNEENFIKLINNYTVKDDEKIKKEIFNFYKSLNNLYDKEKYLDKYIDTNYNKEYIEQSINDYISLIKTNINNIKNIIHKLNEITKEEKEIEYLEKLESYLSEIITIKEYDEYYYIINNIGQLPRLPKNISEELKINKDKIKQAIDNIKKLTKYKSVEEIRQSILITKDYMIEIIDILKQVNIEMNKFKKENNIYEFIDIATLGINLLKQNEVIRNDVKNSIHEIMIDEYQDTNDIQDIFISLISSNNTYMVGDVKQSIYRFRNANPLLFMKKYKDYSNNCNGIKIDLIKNFRSREEVLNNINNIFDYIMDEDIGGAAYKESHRLVFGNNVYNDFNKENYNLEIYNYESNKNKKNEIEAFIIANDIKEKINNKYQIYDVKEKIIRDIKYSDFAILIDRSKQFELYEKIFEYLKIPLTINKNDSFIHSDEMYTILNILKMIYCHIDKSYVYENLKHAFMSITRSFLFNYNDEEILEEILQEDLMTSISNSNSKFNNIYTYTKEISEKIDYMSLDEILLEIYIKFNIRENIVKLGNYNNIKIKLDYLLNKTKELSNIGYTIKEFILYIESVINDEDKDIEFKSNDTKEESVSIMTIHKSKGLEYNICYYPELYREFSKNDIQKQFVFSRKYGLIIPYINEGINSGIYLDLVKDEYKKDEISERLRLFYVALTRAKQKMIILINDQEENTKEITEMVEDRINYKSFRDVLLSIQSILRPYTKQINNIIVDKEYKNIYIKEILKNKTSKKILHKNIEIEFNNINEESYSKKIHTLIDNETRENMEYGNKIHRYLQTADFKKDDSKIIVQLKTELNKFGIDILSSTIYREYEFIYEENKNKKHGIIDLLIESSNDVFIIDYKLKNIDSIEYTNQLQGYKQYIETKTNKNVSCYLFSILNNEIRKIL